MIVKKLYYAIFGYPVLYVIEWEHMTLWNCEPKMLPYMNEYAKENYRLMNKEEILKHG